MEIAEIYRKIVPINMRYYISNMRKEGAERRLLEEIKNGRFIDDFPEECKYLVDNNEIITFPYSFHDEYKTLDIDIDKDSSCKMSYILHEGKKLFFPKGWAKQLLNWNPRFQFAKVNSVLLEYSQE